MSSSIAGEEVELRDLVMQVLESNGTLGKLKSQLRASVFLAMENNSTLKSSSATKDDSKVVTILKSSEGLDVLGLCRDVLSACNLTYTLNVFDSEIRHSLNGSSLPDRTELLSHLRISHDLENIPSSAPLLSSVIALQRIQALAERYSVGADKIMAARRSFSRYESFGCISYEHLLTTLSDAFPTVNNKVLQNYCADHYQDASAKTESNIDFEEFLTLYCYFLKSCSHDDDANDDEHHFPPVGHQKEKNLMQLEPEIVETHEILKIGKTEGKRSPRKGSPKKDSWDNSEESDPLDLLPKISPKSQNSRRKRADLFSIEKSLDALDIEDVTLPVEKKPEPPPEAPKVEKKTITIDHNDNPDEAASFFDERPPWDTEKDYADDFVAEDEVAPKPKAAVEDDCKVTEVSDEDEDVTVDETPSSEHRPSIDLDNRTHSPTSSASDFTLNIESSTSSRSQYPHLANHPRLANVQFLEDVESTKF